MARERGVRLALREDAAGTASRRWIIVAEGAEAGWIDVSRADDVARLRVYVEPGSRRQGIARQAVGRVIGARPFGDDIALTAEVDAADTAAHGLLTSMGFEPVGSAAGAETWERSVASRPRTGPERFMTRDGRIDRWPVREDDLRAVLALVLPRVLSPGEVLREAELNERIARVAADVALLRRHLVDHGFVERTRSGSEYALAAVDNS